MDHQQKKGQQGFQGEAHLEAAPQILCKGSPAVCAGDDLLSPHPRIYLDLEKKGFAVCPYCSQKFVLTDSVTPS